MPVVHVQYTPKLEWLVIGGEHILNVPYRVAKQHNLIAGKQRQNGT